MFVLGIEWLCVVSVLFWVPNGWNQKSIENKQNLLGFTFAGCWKMTHGEGEGSFSEL